MPEWMKKNLPSAYACVYCIVQPDISNNQTVTLVMSAVKKSQARWLEYNFVTCDFAKPYSKIGRSKNPIPYYIVNNPDQPVFPGGRMKAFSNLNWMYEVNETASQCAIREFYEETGAEINPYTCVSILEKYFFYNLDGSIAFVTDPNLVAYSFAGTYFQLSPQDFTKLFKEVYTNLNNNSSGKPRTVDDELSSIYEDPADVLHNKFKSYNRNIKGQRTDWFMAVVSNIV